MELAFRSCTSNNLSITLISILFLTAATAFHRASHNYDFPSYYSLNHVAPSSSSPLFSIQTPQNNHTRVNNNTQALMFATSKDTSSFNTSSIQTVAASPFSNSSSNSSQPTLPNPQPLDHFTAVEKPAHSNLQRLEAGLRRARIALRKAVLQDYNTSKIRDHRLEEKEPFGPVYRNAAIFRRSYLEMEKTLKIFVYPQGEEPLVHNGPCKEIYAVEGRFIQELQGKNPYLTTDPEKAHIFFLPFSISMLVTFLYTPQSRDMNPLLHFVRDYVDLVATTYPFWNRSEGADHFMLSCHDWAPHLSKAHPHLERKAIRAICNSNLSEGYVPSKDVSLPEINLIGGNIPAELGGLPGHKRKHLAFFAGRDHGPVRPILFKYWEGKDDDVRVFQWLPREFSYHEFMKSSKFCICPGGYEVNSPRIVEAIYNDCVPVILADRFVLPFSDVLDWQSFSLHLPEREIPNLKTRLQAVSTERYEAMQRRVREVRRHFVLNQPPKRYDAFHMILHSVWLRRLNVRLRFSS